MSKDIQSGSAEHDERSAAITESDPHSGEEKGIAHPGDDEIRVVIAGAAVLHDETRRALAEVLANHGRSLLNEASRLEAAANPGPAKPMITPAMMYDANTLHRIGYAQGGKSTDRRNWMLGSLAGTFVGGFFTNNLTEPWGAIGFLICGAFALACFNKGSQS